MKRPLASSIVAALALAACRTSPEGNPRPEVLDALQTLPDHGSARRAERRPAWACQTLVDEEGPDVLRVLPDDHLALYADRQVGLLIVDIADPGAPTLLGTSRFSGEPLGIFDVGGAVIVVFRPWDRATTIVRAVDVRRPTLGKLMGELVLEGPPRDARRAGDVVVLTRELGDGGEVTKKQTAVSTVLLDDDDHLTQHDEILLPGGGAVVGGSPLGVAVARESDRRSGNDRTAVTWLGLDDVTATLTRGGTMVIDGVIPRWRRAADHVVDVTEDGQVRVVACATAACPAGGLATYAAMDFANPARPRLLAATMLARAADAVVQFSANQLLVARPPRDPGARDFTELSIFSTNGEPTLLGAVSLRGTVSALALRDDHHVVALGSISSTNEGPRAIIHDLDTRTRPRLVGSLSFGGDWTWSPAYEDDRGLSFSPNFAFGALPMTTARGMSDPLRAVQVIAFTWNGPEAVSETVMDSSDRLVFVDGHLLSFSSDGVSVVPLPGERPALRRWEELGLLLP